MESKRKESSIPFSTRAFKENLRISRTKKYAFLSKSQKMATKRVSAPLIDSILLNMDKFADSIKQEQIKTSKLELTQTTQFLSELKDHWRTLITRISLDNPRADDPETPLPSEFSTYLSRQNLVANEIIKMRSKYQHQATKISRSFSQLSSLRGRSI